jgi:hypothetical protein
LNGNITDYINDYTIDLDEPGLYSFKLNNLKNGCVDQKDIFIREQQAQFTDVVTDATSPSCEEIRNGAIVLKSLNGTAPYKIKFDGKEQKDQLIFDNLWPGIYELQVVDSFGCEVFKEVIVPDPATTTITFDEPLIIQFGDSIVLTPNITESIPGRATIRWYLKDSLICEGCRFITVQPFVNTFYTVKISYDGFCEEEVNVLVRVVKELENAIPNIFSPTSTSGNNIFYIPQVVGIERINRILIFDRWAENVYQGLNLMPGDPTYGWDGHFNGSAVATGVYVVVIELLLEDGTIWKYKGDLTVLR